jgi:hypothetical protein
MANESPTSSVPRRNRILPLIALGFVLSAWGALAAGREHVSRLDLSAWGTDLDISERLAIDRYVSRQFLPYVRVAIALDALALGALCWAGRRGRLRVLGGIVGLVWLVSAGWHGMNWLLNSFFAS